MIKYPEDGTWYLTDGRLADYDSAVVVGIDDPLVTIGSLMDIWASAIEGANYHSMIDIPDDLVKTLERAGVEAERIKAILWDIIEYQQGWIS